MKRLKIERVVTTFVFDCYRWRIVQLSNENYAIERQLREESEWGRGRWSRHNNRTYETISGAAYDICVLTDRGHV